MFDYKPEMALLETTTHHYKKNLLFVATTEDQTHDLNFKLSFDESISHEEDSVGRVLTSFQIDSEVTEISLDGAGEKIHYAIEEWLDKTFDLNTEDHSMFALENKSLIEEDIDSIFEQIWNFIIELGLD